MSRAAFLDGVVTLEKVPEKRRMIALSHVRLGAHRADRSSAPPHCVCRDRHSVGPKGNVDGEPEFALCVRTRSPTADWFSPLRFV
jgi:hypothetical protein